MQKMTIIQIKEYDPNLLQHGKNKIAMNFYEVSLQSKRRITSARFINTTKQVLCNNHQKKKTTINEQRIQKEEEEEKTIEGSIFTEYIHNEKCRHTGSLGNCFSNTARFIDK